MSLKSVSMNCELCPPNWSIFKHLPDFLKKMGFIIKNVSIEINKYSQDFTYDSIDDFDTILKQLKFTYYKIHIYAEDSKSIYISRFCNIYHRELHQITINNFTNENALTEITDFLNLKKESAKKSFDKTVFIAYRFDETGQRFADRVSLFLRLLDFDVVTGKPFSPKSVSEKIKDRLEKQDIVLVIHTNGSDNTWITQESILASIQKPLFILKQKESEFKSGILNDHEYIEFQDNIETTFIQLLEGFKEIGIDFREI